MVNFLKRLKQDQSGVTMVEYGLIITVISITIVASATFYGETLINVFETANEAMDTDEKQPGRDAGG